MSFLSRLGRVFGQGATEQKNYTLTDPALPGLFGIPATGAGVTVSAASAMRVPSVRRAVSLVSEAVATLPFKTYQRGTGKADRAPAKGHPAYMLVHDWANDWTSAEALREQLTMDALLTGHGFAQIARNGAGRAIYMLRMAPSAVSVEYDDFGEPSYRVRLTGGGERVLPFADVLHLQAPGGVSPIVHAREAIGLCLAAEQHLTGFFKNGGRPSGVILHPEKLEADTLTKLAGSWFSTHGADQAGKTAILDEGMSFQEIALKLADAEFSEVRREQVREIARAFNVPPALLYETSRATWSNFEQSHRDFLTGTLRPWISRWQAAYTRALLTPDDRDRFYIEATPDDLLSVEFAARATALSQYRAMGAMTGNEVRGLLNLSPLPGGDVLQNPFTTTGADQAPPKEEAHDKPA